MFGRSIAAIAALDGARVAFAVRANVSAAAAFAPRSVGVAAAAAAIASRAGPLGAISGRDRPEPLPSATAPKFEVLPPGGEVSERLPAKVEDLEKEVAFGKETFHESPSVARGGSLGPCKYGSECMRADCKYDHPPIEHMKPRVMNAQVAVLRRDAKDNYEVLLQRRGRDRKGAGLLSTLGGSKRGEWDEDSRETAIREIIFETGLLDAALLDGAPEAFAKLAKESGARPPLKFEIYHQSQKSDWYALILDGDGTFEPGLTTIQSEDITPIMRQLKVGHIAPVHGHGWVPVRFAARLFSNRTTPALGRRLRQAAFFAIHGDDTHPPSTTLPIPRLAP